MNKKGKGSLGTKNESQVLCVFRINQAVRDVNYCSALCAKLRLAALEVGIGSGISCLNADSEQVEKNG